MILLTQRIIFLYGLRTARTKQLFRNFYTPTKERAETGIFDNPSKYHKDKLWSTYEELVKSYIIKKYLKYYK